MKPVSFKHQNVVFSKNQPPYQPLPALKFDTPAGESEVISCWKLSFKERIRVLFTGRVWLSLLCFNKPLTPSYLSVNRKDMYSHVDDNISIFRKIRNIFKKWSDPLKKCQLFLRKGCSHVDGFLCDFPDCSMNNEFNNNRQLYE